MGIVGKSQSGRACAEPTSRPSAPRSGGGSEATRLDVGEHTRTLFGLTMPPATTTSCGRPESSFRQFLALGNTRGSGRSPPDFCSGDAQSTAAAQRPDRAAHCRGSRSRLAGHVRVGDVLRSGSHRLPDRRRRGELGLRTRGRCLRESGSRGRRGSAGGWGRKDQVEFST